MKLSRMRVLTSTTTDYLIQIDSMSGVGCTFSGHRLIEKKAVVELRTGERGGE